MKNSRKNRRLKEKKRFRNKLLKIFLPILIISLCCFIGFTALHMPKKTSNTISNSTNDINNTNSTDSNSEAEQTNDNEQDSNNLTEDTSKETTDNKDVINDTNNSEINTSTTLQNQQTEIIISSAGDTTIGADISRTTWNTFFQVFEKNNNDYKYFFKNVLPYFNEDDYTTVNLESTFTNSTDKSPKQFNFKAPPEYVEILNEGSIEGVNIANNHIYDYKEKGFQDTISTLKNANIDYFGKNNKVIKTINGQNFGFLGYTWWDGNIYDQMKKDIKELKDNKCIVIINIHWGNEGQYYYDKSQKNIAHFAIDNGADLILGHHPHVMQGIEQYKDKFICYSLGNFCFGGNSNPKDKDTLIVQHKYVFEDNTLKEFGIKVIPCTLSSIQNLNDYCPTPIIDEAEKERFFAKLNKFSPNSGYTINDSYFMIQYESELK